MILLGLAAIVLCVAALFGGVIHATGSVAIALAKYVIAPVAILIAALCLIKCGL